MKTQSPPAPGSSPASPGQVPAGTDQLMAGADGVALTGEIEKPAHICKRFTIGYQDIPRGRNGPLAAAPGRNG